MLHIKRELMLLAGRDGMHVYVNILTYMDFEPRAWAKPNP